MKVVSVGFLEPSDVEELRKAPAVILLGTADEVRACGALLYQDVSVAATEGTQTGGQGKPIASQEDDKAHWRVGRRVPRNIYRDNEPIAMLATPEIAAEIVNGMNDVERLRAALHSILDEITDEAHEDEAGDDKMLDSLMKIHAFAEGALITTSAPIPADGRGEP